MRIALPFLPVFLEEPISIEKIYRYPPSFLLQLIFDKHLICACLLKDKINYKNI